MDKNPDSMVIPRKSLFRKTALAESRKDVTTTMPKPSGPSNIPTLEEYQSNNPDYCKIALTVNICPEVYMNRKKWKSYTNDAQNGILFRVERSFRKLYPDVIQEHYYTEICPNNGNLHFHALYSVPSEKTEIFENFWSKYSPKNDDHWRTTFQKPIYDEKGWIIYIRKDLH